MTVPSTQQRPVYLASFLAPLSHFLARDDVTDLYVNRPGELWVETLGGRTERHDVAALDARALDRLARQIAAQTHQGISREHPLLSAALPDGARVQIVAPPATRGPMAIAIRKHLASDLTLADYQADGAFDAIALDDGDVAMLDRRLHDLLRAGEVAEMLALAVRARRNIVISGGTATGKTTFLNALLREIPAHERLIVIEDAPEVHLSHANAIGLIANRNMLGEASVGSEDLLNASLRMRPDRIILGELRGPEAYTFLRAVNTGHPGSMTTIHADTPERAIEQLALLVLQGGTRLERNDIVRYVRSIVDVFVQLSRVDGRRRVSHIRLRHDFAGEDRSRSGGTMSGDDPVWKGRP